MTDEHLLSPLSGNVLNFVHYKSFSFALSWSGLAVTRWLPGFIIIVMGMSVSNLFFGWGGPFTATLCREARPELASTAMLHHHRLQLSRGTCTGHFCEDKPDSKAHVKYVIRNAFYHLD